MDKSPIIPRIALEDTLSTYLNTAQLKSENTHLETPTVADIAPNLARDPIYTPNEIRISEFPLPSLEIDVEEFPDKKALELGIRPSLLSQGMKASVVGTLASARLSSPYSTAFKGSPFLSSRGPKPEISAFEKPFNLESPERNPRKLEQTNRSPEEAPF